MKNDVDSLSYMMGVANTQGLDMYLQQQGVDSTYMAEFLKGVTDGANKTSPKDVAYMVGLQVGQQVGGRMFDMMSNAYLATILLKAWIKQISWQVLSQL